MLFSFSGDLVFIKLNSGKDYNYQNAGRVDGLAFYTIKKYKEKNILRGMSFLIFSKIPVI